MCITGLDGFNIAVVLSQQHAKILAEVLANTEKENMMAVCVGNNYTAHDILGATSGFVSTVTNALTTLQNIRDKQEEHSSHGHEPSPSVQ